MDIAKYKNLDPKKLTQEQKDAIVAEAKKAMRELGSQDPFWTFEPTIGDISKLKFRDSDEEPIGVDENGDHIYPERPVSEFLKKYLKPDDIPQRLDGQLDGFLSKASIVGFCGGNQCLGGEQEIYDPVADESIPVANVDKDFHVWAWDGDKLVVAKALKPFRKKIDDLYTIKLSNGQEFVASLSHRVLTKYGYRPISELNVVKQPYPFRSNSDICLSVPSQDVDRFGKITQGFVSGCPTSLHLCDELPRLDQDSDLKISPLRAYALRYSGYVSAYLDGFYSKYYDNRLCRWLRHLSNLDVRNLLWGHVFDFVSQSFYTFWKRAYPLSQASTQSHDALGHLLRPISSLTSQATHNDTLFSSSTASLPVSPLVVISIVYKREDYKWDFTVPKYHNYLCSGVIHHNSGKSSGGGAVRGFIKATGELPHSLREYADHFRRDIERVKKRQKEGRLVRGRVIGVDFKQFKNTLLPTWKEWCPRDYLKKGKWEESFMAQDNLLTLYKGKKAVATIEFMTNKMDTDSFQGPPIDFVIYDEEPRQDIYKENLLRFTTADRLDITFCWTPTHGISWATDLFSEGIFEGKEVKGNIELFKLCSVTNPRANIEVLKEILDGFKSEYEVLKMRLLGEFISLSGLVYGKLFNRSIHVIEPFELNHSEYMVVRGLDPHLVKPTACVEIAVDRMGFEYVVGTYMNDVDTEIVKDELAQRARDRKYRLAWTRCDKSANSTIKALGDRNIFLELGRGKNAIPALDLSEKATGSIHAGVDQIKRLLKINEVTKQPQLFIFNLPENQLLIKAFLTMDRETYSNEDEKGTKDKINEGKHDAHAALRYAHQRVIRWMPAVEDKPQPEEEENFV